MKRLKIAGLVIVAVPLGLWLWAAVRLARLETRWKAEVAAERARGAAERRPPLRGEARPGNGAPEYLAALERFASAFHPHDLYVGNEEIEIVIRKAAAAAPEPLPPEIAAELTRSAAGLEAIREATRAERCDFELRPELEDASRPPDLIALSSLEGLLILAGHERALAGDFRGAAERYLDVARFGADLDHGGAVPTIWLGTTLRAGLGALEREIAVGGLGAADLGEVDRELVILEGLLEPGANVLRRERLGMDAEWIRMGYGLASGRFYIGFAGFDGPAYDATLREAEAALALPDRAAQKERLARIIAEGEKSSVLPIRVAMVHLTEVPKERRESEAHLRLTRAAAAVAKARLERGAFPESLAEASEESLLDPFDGKPLRYSRAKGGRTAKIWSIGRNEVDDGGVGPSANRREEGDIVVEVSTPAR